MTASAYEDAAQLYRTGQFYTCLEACERILAEHPEHPPTLHLVGMLCYRAGDIAAAADWFRRCLAVAPDHAEAHIDLALMLKKQGSLDEALNHYRRGLALDPSNAQAHYNFGLALRLLGRTAEAATAFRAAVGINPFVVDGYNSLGLAEADLGHNDAAIEAFRKAIAVIPEAIPAYRNLATVARRAGRLDLAREAFRWGVSVHGDKVMGTDLAQVLEDSGQIDAAFAVLERTIAENPDHADACEALAAMHFRRHNFVESLAALRRCVAIDPTRAEVHMRIHTMAQIVGDRDLALDHQRQALEVTRLFTERGVDALRPHLLLLKAAGDWQANLPTDFIVKRDDWGAVYHYFVSADGPPPFEDLPFCDVIFNAVAEPDLTRGELNTADAIIAALAQPVLNRPDRVAATGRADVAALLDDIPHLQVPTTLRLSGSDAAAILESALAAGRIALPVLLRPVGSHAGQGVRLVGERAELASAIRQFSGSDLYATRYVDYRNADGLFRKYRVIVVDGRPYPFHMAISKRWLVHYYNAVIDDPAMMDREEERFLGEFETVFAPELRAAFVEMARRLELDFFGVDCTIGPDGRLLLFEVDVGVIVHVMDDPVRHAYKHKYVPRIFEAVKKMIEGRVAAKFAVASH
jgi:tetratricopeptide (TPR) repeat protein